MVPSSFIVLEAKTAFAFPCAVTSASTMLAPNWVPFSSGVRTVVISTLSSPATVRETFETAVTLSSS